MPSRDWKSRITDILQAVQDIEQFTQEMTFEQTIHRNLPPILPKLEKLIENP